MPRNYYAPECALTRHALWFAIKQTTGCGELQGMPATALSASSLRVESWKLESWPHQCDFPLKLELGDRHVDVFSTRKYFIDSLLQIYISNFGIFKFYMVYSVDYEYYKRRLFDVR